MTLIVAKSEYIYSANYVYSNLKDYMDIYEKEAYIINYLKCALVRNEDIGDFYINDCYVDVNKNSDGYDLYFDSYVMSIEVYDKQIIDVVINKDQLLKIVLIVNMLQY